MDSQKNVAAIVLAAGTSSRLGKGNKLLLKIADKTILQWSVENVLASKVTQVFVVAGKDLDKTSGYLKQLNVSVVQNADYKSGMSSSLKAGIKAVGPSTKGALVLLADQPNLKPQTINYFIEKFKDSDKKIISGRYGGVTGNPVLFHQEFFADLLKLQGDAGARSLLNRYPNEIETIEISPEECLDIDTSADFHKMKTLLENRSG